MIEAIEGPVAGITLSREGLRVLKRLARSMKGLEVYVHDGVPENIPEARRFDRVSAITEAVFYRYRGLIYVMPAGIVVRAVGRLAENKHTDPAVVVMDVYARWAVSLLSGHEGGANRLAEQAAWIMDAEPVVTTTSEAVRTVIAGIGCRKGASADDIIRALGAALSEAGLGFDDVRLLASADIKQMETGLQEAAKRLNIGLRFISSDTIRSSFREFDRSKFVMSKVNLPAVAEPSALLAGSRTCLILKKRVYNQVTVALARERCLWWE
ncbi:MAG: cobalamin biosynthesis protein [Desulfosalsimonadaceae bacterium]